LTKRYALGFGIFIFYSAQVFGQHRIETGRLRWKEHDQSIVCSLADGGLHRKRTGRRTEASVTFVFTNDSIHGVEHRDVNNRNRASSAARPNLFAEHTILTGRNRCVINAYGLKEYDDAIVDCSTAIRLNDKASMAYNHRGYAYEMKNSTDLARADYTKALEIDPKNQQARNNLSKLRPSMKQP